MDEENYIDIDDTQLDREVLVQPKRMHKWGKKVAKARLRYNEAKANVDLVFSDLWLKILAGPSEYNLEKTTEKIVEAAIIVQPEYQAAVKAMNRAKFEMDNCETVVNALDHRKTALELRIRLFGMEYYAEPREDKRSRQALDDQMVRSVFRPLKKKKRKPE